LIDHDVDQVAPRRLRLSHSHQRRWIADHPKALAAQPAQRWGSDQDFCTSAQHTDSDLLRAATMLNRSMD
jgi:hypothetical protein